MDFEKYTELKLTAEQLKAAKSVYRAMRKAHKLNVVFWDDYGTLSCFNREKITRLNMDGKTKGNISIRKYDITYYEHLDNFKCGNSDDEVWAEPSI